MKAAFVIIVGCGFLMLTSARLYADVNSAAAQQSSIDSRKTQQQPTISNEAEYAEFVRKNEALVKSSSSKSNHSSSQSSHAQAQ